MKNCIDYVEQLSAYHDNELSEQETQKLLGHLNACEDCSALLEVYKEISVAADISDTLVPDALRIGVMNRIKAEKPVIATKRKRNIQFFLTRYMPIAACLAVVLLVWGFWGDLFAPRGADNFAPLASSFGDYSAPAGDEMLPGLSSDRNDLHPTGTSTGGGDTSWHVFDASAPDAAAPPQNKPHDDGIGNESFIVDADAASIEALLAFDALNRRAQRLTRQEVDETMEFLKGASCWILITQEHLSHMEDYEVSPHGPWHNWYSLYEIPNDEVHALLTQLSKTDNYVVMNNNDSTLKSSYSVVLYSIYR
ncbi:MAG: zf-HC2 domain-containing protein [Oscillospiraceae bacterium]|nr:zf-HC2 domain-containing protein [Oscillospiraceae bacterium]